MRTKSLSQLRERIRSLGEIRETYTPDSELDYEINQSLAELYDKLVAASDGDYYESEYEIDVVSGTASYDLPDDFYKLLGVDVKLNNGNYVLINKYNWGQRNKYSIYRIGAVSREWAMYRIRGSKFTLVPEPNWAESEGIRLIYIPAPPELSLPEDEFDGIAGWEDWIIFDCLIKLIGGKEEGDVSTWERQMAKLDARLQNMIDSRDRGEADSVRDIDSEETERLWPKYGTPP